MGSSSMKVHPFARGFWDNHQTHESQSSLTLGCKRFRTLVPKVSSSHNNATFDLKSFIKPETSPRKLVSSSDSKKDSPSQQQGVETHPGGTRWNPTQEQIGILEMLYRGGMRTPNAQQIEQITEQLSKYGKIEGKNVFYWFQNHKARERQKQKRSILGLTHNPRTPPPAAAATATHQINTSITLTLHTMTRAESEEQEISPYKRKFRSWMFDCSEENQKKDYSEQEGKTLELFPLHPEGLIRIT